MPRYDLSPTEAAAYLGVSVESIKRWARDGTLKGAKTPGGWWKFSTDDLDQAIRQPEPQEAS